MEELAHCTYCMRTGRKKNLITIEFDEKNIWPYCPDCTLDMLKLALKEPWNKDKSLHWITDRYVMIE